MKTRPRSQTTPVVTDEMSESEPETSDVPADQAVGKAQKILAWRDTDSGREFLTKFTGRSYNDCKWLSESDFLATRAGTALLRRYCARLPAECAPPYFDERYVNPERLIARKGDEVLVKWEGLDYDEATWEKVSEVPRALVNELQKRERIPALEERLPPPRPKASDWRPITRVKASRVKKLMVKPYQLDGLNFLAKAWYEGRNAILADEMGLGKTLQSCVFMDYLAVTQKMKGPFLVVAPLSTIPHWERELAEWTQLSAIAFYGIKERRKLQKQYELFYEGSRIPKFDVLITTYEYVIKEQEMFSEIHWRAVVVDEAHRMKNRDSKLVAAMRMMNTDFKLLLTGTPLQNNTEELWTLLNFIDTAAFEDLNDFQSRFGELSESDQIVELKSLLKPLMLRRRKGDVEKAIAPLEEIIVECPMTPHQRAYYKNIYSKNLEYLTRGLHAQGNSTNLKNIFMELRKVCNHPYLINGAEDQILVERKEAAGIDREDELSIDFVNDSLIKSAGKMVLLDKLLSKLKADGHRVLIFSQMTRMLDILQDYLNYRGYPFERLDGSVRGDLRQAAIDRFNEPGSDRFVFLLCTKAGGVGINLMSADRVIIYDSDWNPQNDIQATARCHRIGQTKEVKMFRFITAKTYERKMFDRASVKLGLDRAVLESETTAAKTEEMEKLLRLGAYYAFEEETGETEKFGEEDIDVILSRSRRITHENAFGDGGNFSVAQFELDEADNNVDLEDPNFWQKYLPEVIEDDIDFEGVSIAERKRLMRENGSTEDIAQMEQTAEDGDEAFRWSKQKLSTLQTVLLKFGWGRWRAIYEKSALKCSIGEVKNVCYVILKWILEASEEKNPVVESIFGQANTPDNQAFERKFAKTHKKNFVQIISSGAQWKLVRLDALYFLNLSVTTCPNPPDGLIVPDILAQKPAEWWTEADDKALMYGVWKLGYQQYGEITFSNAETPAQTMLTNRLKHLIKGLKTLYVRLKDIDGTATFNYETLRKSQNVWTKKDHKTICQALVNYGYPSAAKFREYTQLNHRDEDSIDEYVKSLLAFCEEASEGATPDLGILVDAPAQGSAVRILRRVKLFKDARQRLGESAALKSDDRKLLEYIDENGIANLADSSLLVERFGKEGLEGKVLKRAKDVSRVREYRGPRSTSSSSHSTLLSYATPKYETDENGKPKMPIRIGMSLVILNMGHVVTDRPGFHTERYLYPDGYLSERLFPSMEDPTMRVWWRSLILDDGGDGPLFRCEMKDDSSVFFEGGSPSAPWLAAVRAIEDRKRELGMVANRSLTISGPECYGLSHPIVQRIMQTMEGVDQCKRFRRVQLEEEHVESDTHSDEPPSEPPSEPAEPQEPAPVMTEKMPSTGFPVARQRQKACLVLNLSHVVKESNKTSVPELVVDAATLLQRDALDVSVPYDENPIMTALERMIPKIAEYC